MRTKILAWVILAGLAVGLFYATQFGLVKLNEWVVDTTPALKASASALECATIERNGGDCNE